MGEGIPEPYKGPPTKLMLLHAWFAQHKHGRLLEFLFWATPGILFILAAWAGYRYGWVSDPIALLTVVIGACFIGWAALPQRKPAAKPAPNPKSRRAQK